MNGEQAASIIIQNRRAYGRIAQEWEKRQAAGYDRQFHARCRREFLKHLTGDRILDIGCGLGLDSQEFARAGLRVVAADIATEFLSIIGARRPGHPVVAVDMTKPCFCDGAFDGIYALASFLHVPPGLAGQTLAGFARMLAPKGILFLHHVEATCGRSSYRVDNLLIRDNPALCFCHPPEDLARMLSDAGMRTVAVTRVLPARHPSEPAARNGLSPYQLIAEKLQIGG